MNIFRKSLFLAVLLVFPVSVFAYEYDAAGTEKLMTLLIKDIGGMDAIAKNSGKILVCSHGGTKKIAIVRKRGETSYTGEYLNCNQNGSIRDGIFEIVIQGNEVLKSTAKRSRNGELFDAAMDDDAGKVKALIKTRADVNYTETTSRIEGVTIDEWTPLMSAAVSGNLDIAKQLVKAGAWVNYMNSLAVNAVWIAANNGKLEVVKYLVKQGAYVDNRNKEDVTPLMAAAINGHLEVAKCLVAAKASLDLVHKNGEGDTALMFALAKGHTAIARILIEAGADVNIRNKFGISALHVAVSEGNLDVTKLLIEHKADLAIRTSDGMTALEIARAKGHSDVAALIEKSVKIKLP